MIISEGMHPGDGLFLSSAVAANNVSAGVRSRVILVSVVGLDL